MQMFYWWSVQTGKFGDTIMNIQGENNLSGTSGTESCGRRSTSVGRFPVPAPEGEGDAWKDDAQRPRGSLGCGAAPRSPGRCCSERLPGASRDGPPEGTALSLGAGASALPASQPPAPHAGPEAVTAGSVSEQRLPTPADSRVLWGHRALGGETAQRRAGRTAGAALAEASSTAKAARPPRPSACAPRWASWPRTDSSWCSDAPTASDSCLLKVTEACELFPETCHQIAFNTSRGKEFSCRSSPLPPAQVQWEPAVSESRSAGSDSS